MRLGTYPLIAYGSIDAIAGAGWTDFNTPAATGGEADPFGSLGGGGVLLTDNTAGAAEGRFRATAYVLADDFLDWTIFIKAGTAAVSVMQVRDTDAADYPMVLSAAWTGGVPVVTPSATGGNPVPILLATLPVASNWYLVKARCPWTPGNHVREELYGASGTAADIGSTRYFLRNAVLLDDLYGYRRFARPMDGQQVGVAPSGARAGWSWGDEWVRRGGVRWLPDAARAAPVIVSGYQGANPGIGVNAGVEAMLREGWKASPLTWVPDRTDCSRNQDVYLTAPTKEWDPVPNDGNGDAEFELELVTAAAPGRVA